MNNRIPNMISIVKILFLFLFSLATAYITNTAINSPFTISFLLAETLVYFIVFFIALKLSDRFFQPTTNEADYKKYATAINKKNYLILTIIFIIIYFLYLLVFYPGACGWDTINQIADLKSGTAPLPFSWIHGQQTVSVLLNDHHPVFTTLIMSAFYVVGHYLGNNNLGMFIYNIVQIVLFSLINASILLYMLKIGTPKRAISIVLLFLISPVFAFITFFMGKDSIFLVFFLLYYMFFIQLFISLISNKIINRKQWLIFIILSCFIALSVKKGMYIALISNLSLLLLTKSTKDKIAIITSAVTPMILIIIIMGKILFPIFNIYPGGKQEMYGFAFQQTAYTLINDPDSFSKKDKSVFFAVIDIPENKLKETYNPKTTDGIKDHYNFYATDDQLNDFLKLWITQGLNHPKDYIDATIKVNGGFFSPTETLNNLIEPVYSKSINGFTQTKKTEFIRTKVVAVYNWLKENVVTYILFSNVLYTWWIPLLTLIHLVKKKSKLVICYIPILVNILFLIIGPICFTRYAWPQFGVLPLLISFPYLDTFIKKDFNKTL